MSRRFGSPQTFRQGICFGFGRRRKDSAKLLERLYGRNSDLLEHDVMLQEAYAGSVKHRF